MIDLQQQDIIKMELEELWNTYQILMEEEDEETEQRLDKIYEEETEEIKNGTSQKKVPLQWVLNGWYEPHPSSGKVTIMGMGKHELLPFLEDIEKRKTLMRKILIDNIEDESSTQPRN